MRRKHIIIYRQNAGFHQLKRVIVNSGGVGKVARLHFLFQCAAEVCGLRVELRPDANRFFAQVCFCILELERGDLLFHRVRSRVLHGLSCLLYCVICGGVFFPRLLESGVKVFCKVVILAHFVVLSVANRVQLPLSYIIQLLPQAIPPDRGQRFPVCAVPGLHLSPLIKAQSSPRQTGSMAVENGQDFRRGAGS